MAAISNLSLPPGTRASPAGRDPVRSAIRIAAGFVPSATNALRQIALFLWMSLVTALAGIVALGFCAR